MDAQQSQMLAFDSAYGITAVLMSGQQTTFFLETFQQQQEILFLFSKWKRFAFEDPDTAAAAASSGFLQHAPVTFKQQNLPIFEVWLPVMNDKGKEYVLGTVLDFREISVMGCSIQHEDVRKERARG